MSTIRFVELWIKIDYGIECYYEDYKKSLKCARMMTRNRQHILVGVHGSEDENHVLDGDSIKTQSDRS